MKVPIQCRQIMWLYEGLTTVVDNEASPLAGVTATVGAVVAAIDEEGLNESVFLFFDRKGIVTEINGAGVAKCLQIGKKFLEKNHSLKKPTTPPPLVTALRSEKLQQD